MDGLIRGFADELLTKLAADRCRCGKRATIKVLWAEGHGYRPACEDCKEKIADEYRKKDDFSGFKKYAISTELVKRVVDKELVDHPDHVGAFIQHLRSMGGARAAAARGVAVHQAREFLAGTPRFAAPRVGNPTRAVSGTIVDGVKVASTDREKLANDPIQKRISVQGLSIAVEWPAGSTRKYYSKTNPKKVDYEKKMSADYGYIPGTKDHDGEQLDAYVGPDRKSTHVYIVKQLKDDGSFDEHKVILGCNSIEEAKKLYLAHMPPKRLGKVEETDMETFKKEHLERAREMRKAATPALIHVR